MAEQFQSKVLHRAEDLCNGVGLLLELWVAAEELLALLQPSSPREALGISPAPQAAKLPGGAPHCQAKAQLLLQGDKGPSGPCEV